MLIIHDALDPGEDGTKPMAVQMQASGDGADRELSGRFFLLLRDN